MLEEQVNVLRLDFEKRTGTELLANSCLWPWLIRHAGWLDASENKWSHAISKSIGQRHSLTPDAQIRTGQSTEVTVDGTRDSGVVDWTRTMHTSSSLKTVERLHELSADFL